jgi:hypothetical protein
MLEGLAINCKKLFNVFSMFRGAVPTLRDSAKYGFNNSKLQNEQFFDSAFLEEWRLLGCYAACLL